MLRITVNGGGCSGFTYCVRLRRCQSNDDDKTFETDGVKVVVVDVASLEFIDGAVLNLRRIPRRHPFRPGEPQRHIFVRLRILLLGLLVLKHIPTRKRPPRRAAFSVSGCRTDLEASLGDELGVEIGINGFRAAFRAITRILDPAERRFDQSKTMMVDRDHAAFKCGTNCFGCFC